MASVIALVTPALVAPLIPRLRLLSSSPRRPRIIRSFGLCTSARGIARRLCTMSVRRGPGLPVGRRRGRHIAGHGSSSQCPGPNLAPLPVTTSKRSCHRQLHAKKTHDVFLTSLMCLRATSRAIASVHRSLKKDPDTLQKLPHD